MAFEDEYEKFIQYHCKHRTGPSRERIEIQHGHAEELFLKRVWWPAFHHFAGLHPEYEIYDYKDGYRYIDFAYIQPNFKIAIEIDGHGPHWRNTTGWQFSDHCQRQNHLVIDGWHVLRFAYNDVEERSRVCQQTIQQLIGKLLGDASSALSLLGLMDREIVRFAIKCGRPITPTQVSLLLHVSPDSAARYMRNLCAISWMRPASGTSRIRSYQLHPSRTNIQL